VLKDHIDEAELRRIEGLVTAARDQLVASEQAMSRLQSLLDALLSAVPALVAVDGRVVVAWSAELERLSGVAAPTALGRRVSGLLADADDLADGVHLVERRDGQLRVFESRMVDLTRSEGGSEPARAPGRAGARSASG
jgi:PAS domain-containing protein